MTKLWGIGFLLLLMNLNLWGQNSGSDLLELCEDPSTGDMTACSMYIAGSLDMFTNARSEAMAISLATTAAVTRFHQLEPQESLNILIDELVKQINSEFSLCPPTGVTMRQTILVYVKWLKEHPERLHENASKLLLDAIKETWQCPPPKPIGEGF